MLSQLEEEPQWNCHANSNGKRIATLRFMARFVSHLADMQLPPLTQLEEKPHWYCYYQVFWQRKSHCEIAKRGATLRLPGWVLLAIRPSWDCHAVLCTVALTLTLPPQSSSCPPADYQGCHSWNWALASSLTELDSGTCRLHIRQKLGHEVIFEIRTYGKYEHWPPMEHQ